MGHELWIGGKWVAPESGKTFAVYNPTTGEELDRLPLAGIPEIDMAVDAARNAFSGWSGITQDERSRVMTRIAAAIRENSAEVSQVEIAEHGSNYELAHDVLGTPYLIIDITHWF